MVKHKQFSMIGLNLEQNNYLDTLVCKFDQVGRNNRVQDNQEHIALLVHRHNKS